MIVNKYGGGSGSGSGERGPQGYQGPQGVEGAVGPQGYQGPAGEGGSGSGDAFILKATSGFPTSSSTEWTSEITTGFTQFRVPLNATSECSLQEFHMGGDQYTTDIWWHGEEDPKRWDMRGTATNWEIINLNTEFTYTVNTNTITAAIDGDYVVVTLSQPVTEYNIVDGIQISKEAVVPIYPEDLEQGDVYAITADTRTLQPKDVVSSVTVTYTGSEITFKFYAGGEYKTDTGGIDANGNITGAWGTEDGVILGPWGSTYGIQVTRNGNEYTLTTMNPGKYESSQMYGFNIDIDVQDFSSKVYQFNGSEGEELLKAKDLPQDRLLPINGSFNDFLRMGGEGSEWVSVRQVPFTDMQKDYTGAVLMSTGPYADEYGWGLIIKKLTQTEYDNMSSHDSNTLYIIIPDTNAGA